MNAKQMLIAARELIAQGWIQHAFSRNDGERARYCIVGALDEIRLQASYAESVESYSEAALLLVSGLNIRCREPSGAFGYLMAFNDDEKTTQYSVLRLFDRAIAGTQNYWIEQLKQRAQERDLIQDDEIEITTLETNDGRRNIRQTSVFKLPIFNTAQVYFTNLFGTGHRRRVGPARREVERITG